MESNYFPFHVFDKKKTKYLYDDSDFILFLKMCIIFANFLIGRRLCCRWGYGSKRTFGHMGVWWHHSWWCQGIRTQLSNSFTQNQLKKQTPVCIIEQRKKKRKTTINKEKRTISHSLYIGNIKKFKIVFFFGTSFLSS